MKRILVVGGCSGIGKELINALLLDGDNSIVNLDINPFVGEESRVENIRLDLSSDCQYEESCEEAMVGGAFSYLYFCSGIAEEPSTFLKSDIHMINNIASINSTSVPKLISRVEIKEGGGIVVISSSHSKRAACLDPIYSATKGFIDSFVRSYSRTLINMNPSNPVRINAVNPEMVDTPLIRNLFAGKQDELERVISARIMKRLLSPVEICDAMMFLNSEKAKAITGVNLSVGGEI